MQMPGPGNLTEWMQSYSVALKASALKFWVPFQAQVPVAALLAVSTVQVLCTSCGTFAKQF